MEAVNQSRLDVVRALLESNANPSLRDPNGLSILLMAQRRRNAEVIALLRQFGAQP